MTLLAQSDIFNWPGPTPNSFGTDREWNEWNRLRRKGRAYQFCFKRRNWQREAAFVDQRQECWKLGEFFVSEAVVQRSSLEINFEPYFKLAEPSSLFPSLCLSLPWVGLFLHFFRFSIWTRILIVRGKQAIRTSLIAQLTCAGDSTSSFFNASYQALHV